MLTLQVALMGEFACGKTRATNAIEKALKEELPDKPYEVNWSHIVEGRVTERGSFTSEGN